jgi:hypothetical protein
MDTQDHAISFAVKFRRVFANHVELRSAAEIVA